MNCTSPRNSLLSLFNDRCVVFVNLLGERRSKLRLRVADQGRGAWRVGLR